MVFGRSKRRINRILVVEDEALIAFETEYSLESEGFEVVATVDTVAEAVRVLETEPVDLALLDVTLSDGSGVEIARVAAEKGVCVVFATGSCPGDADGLAHGCLSKPFGAREVTLVVAAIERVLAGKRPRKLPPTFTLFERAFAANA
ncbi:response regulator [Sphingomonas gilva]|uniref:Response regulator n=1 Tax=Sphingomonas gilva TaxID=2305907 RepID=A0A396RRX0_9SPHN|nr:response regulator [Sphingomonas gilva]RHW16331.1 response regulator [Sphingomonas gilva]